MINFHVTASRCLLPSPWALRPISTALLPGGLYRSALRDLGPEHSILHLNTAIEIGTAWAAFPVWWWWHVTTPREQSPTPKLYLGLVPLAQLFPNTSDEQIISLKADVRGQTAGLLLPVCCLQSWMPRIKKFGKYLRVFCQHTFPGSIHSSANPRAAAGEKGGYSGDFSAMNLSGCFLCPFELSASTCFRKDFQSLSSYTLGK